MTDVEAAILRLTDAIKAAQPHIAASMDHFRFDHKKRAIASLRSHLEGALELIDFIYFEDRVRSDLD